MKKSDISFEIFGKRNLISLGLVSFLKDNYKEYEVVFNDEFMIVNKNNIVILYSEINEQDIVSLCERCENVLLIINNYSPDSVKYLIKNGVKAIVHCETSLSVIKEAIEALLSGKKYICSRVSSSLLDDLFKIKEKSLVEENKKLSKRELEVFELVINGKTNREVADILKISTRTVEKHRDNIRNKLEVKTSMELANYKYLAPGLSSGLKN
ncbi:MAG: hypothetical protein A2W91_20605 [Bacteroidetes bacterium GWF2_38_335]|nr:MAG: hypothetical protein A2W91_20605 [Bacteroidetes bacterium GWF2_38_335]OFY79446.1 MAG: hypothetical protein A2281_13480 [Bacteroidetes bacterium RIFOXYA12_FULL_38_20]HBS86621.1 hypothetical protein [Bacteroidales bacterium]